MVTTTRSTARTRARAAFVDDYLSYLLARASHVVYKEFDGQTFTGLFAPAGTPAEIVTKLHDTLAKILKDPEVVAKFNALGAEAVPMTPAEFRSYLEREDSKWIPVVRKANIKAG